ncbi:MAG: hypothetical protein PWQ89_1815 [Verrucomicrobiota bacterium]|jgi:hypothetical protein|nr:hypothetical protein [Verrucomicrobiota bacterium]
MLTGYLESESERFCGFVSGRYCISESKLNANAMRDQGKKTGGPDKAAYFQAVAESVVNNDVGTLELEKMNSHQYHRNNVGTRQQPAVRMMQSAA